MKELQEYFENKTNALEDRVHEQLERLDSEVRICSDEVQTFTSKYETSKFDNNMTLLVKLNSLNKDFEELVSSQKKLQTEVTNLNQAMGESKLATTSSIITLQAKLSEVNLMESRVQKLEGQVETLQSSVNSLKQNSPSRISSSNAGYESKYTWSTLDKYQYRPETISTKPVSQQGQGTDSANATKEESPTRRWSTKEGSPTRTWAAKEGSPTRTWTTKDGSPTRTWTNKEESPTRTKALSQYSNSNSSYSYVREFLLFSVI